MDRRWKKAFDEIKQIVTRDALLIYPDFNKHFDIHMDASEIQLGAVISQDRKKSFYICKLTNPQQRYEVMENEFLSIVETLKEFHTILLGQGLKIYTDSTLIECYGGELY